MSDNMGSAEKDLSRVSDSVVDIIAIRAIKRTIGYLVAVVAFIATVLGAFGYNVITDVEAASAELRERNEALLEEIAQTQRLNQSLARELAIEQQRVEREIDAFENAGRMYQDILVGQVQALVGQAATITSNAQRAVSESERTATRVRAQLDSLVGLSAAVEGELGELVGSRTAYQAVLDSVRQRVFGSWTVVVREKTATPISGTGLSLRMATINDDRLRDFEIYSVESGETLFGPRDVRTSESVQVRAGDRGYVFTPRYTIEHWPGKDVAGIQIDEETLVLARAGGIP